MKAFLFMLLYGCSEVVVVPEPTDLASIAEKYCIDHPELPCGHVYACNTPADNAIGWVEICIPQWQDVSAAESIYGTCDLSPRQAFKDKNSHLCWWCCGEGCGRGCNAYSGCFCQ